MTLVLELPQEVEAALRARAEAEGRPAEEIAVEALRDLLDPTAAADEKEREEIGRALDESMADIAAGRVLTLEESRTLRDARLARMLRLDSVRPETSS